MTPRPSSSTQIKQAETEIAVLQVQFVNMSEKVDEVKSDVKDLRNVIDAHHAETQNLFKSFQVDNAKSYRELNVKITRLEKWRWMLMGAGGLAGALGWNFFGKLINFG